VPQPQDQQDVEQLIALQGEHMDLARVRAAARDLAATLDEPQRTEESAASQPPSRPPAISFNIEHLGN
jgi:hypothetical protein